MCTWATCRGAHARVGFVLSQAAATERVAARVHGVADERTNEGRAQRGTHCVVSYAPHAVWLSSSISCPDAIARCSAVVGGGEVVGDAEAFTAEGVAEGAVEPAAAASAVLVASAAALP